MKIVLLGDPRTKKNSQRLVHLGTRMIPITSKAYSEYERACLAQITETRRLLAINFPVNVKCEYYMGTRRKVDLVNLLEATCDILVEAGVILDDNSRIVAGHDGSRVYYDKQNPRVEIDITMI